MNEKDNQKMGKGKLNKERVNKSVKEQKDNVKIAENARKFCTNANGYFIVTGP